MNIANEDAHVALLGGLVFALVFLSLFLIMRFVEARHRVRQRAIAYNPSTSNSLGEPAWNPRSMDPSSRLLYLVEGGLNEGKSDKHSKIRNELMRAGWFGKDAVFTFYTVRFTLGICAGIAAAIALSQLLPALNAVQFLAICGAAVSVGALIPQGVVQAQQREMLTQCRRGFPDFLDLMVVCAESGVPPRAAVERVSREIVRTHPYLGANLFLLHLQLRAGRSFSEALASMGRRVDVEEVRSLGSLLQQTEELGTNVSTALRTFSAEMRARRMLQAEEKAHGLPVKLVLPLALFIFPVMLLVVFLPVIIRLKSNLLQ